MRSFFDPDTIFSVPIDTTRLIGRDELSNDFAEMIISTKAAAAQIIGEHGVGKSRFALRTAHLLHSKRPNWNIIYVDCRPAPKPDSKSSKSVEGLVRDLAVASGSLPSLRASINGSREETLLRKFHNGRWIIFLDSFENLTEDAIKFSSRIPLKGSATLVVSATTKVSWIERETKLPPLTDIQLSQIIESNTNLDKVEQLNLEMIITACRGLPGLAIRASGYLSDEVATEKIVEELEKSYLQFYQDELNILAKDKIGSSILSLICISTKPLKVSQCAAILDLPDIEVSDRLREFYRSGLIDLIGQDYRPKDPVSKYYTDKVKIETIEKFISWISKLTEHGDSFLKNKKQIENLDGNQQQIISFIQLDDLIFSTDTYSSIRKTYIKTFIGVLFWLYSRLYFEEIEKVILSIDIEDWRRLSDEDLIRGTLLWGLKPLVMKNNFEGSLHLINTVEEILKKRRGNGRKYIESSLHVLSPQLRRLDTLSTCEGLIPKQEGYSDIEQYEEWLRNHGHVELHCISINRRGNIALENGDYVQAQNLYKKVLTTLNEVWQADWAIELAIVVEGNLGVLHSKQGDWNAAAQKFEAIWNKTSQDTDRCVMLAELSRVYFYKHKYIRSYSYWRKSRVVSKRLGQEFPRCDSDPEWRYSFSPRFFRNPTHEK